MALGSNVTGNGLLNFERRMASVNLANQDIVEIVNGGREGGCDLRLRRGDE